MRCFALLGVLIISYFTIARSNEYAVKGSSSKFLQNSASDSYQAYGGQYPSYVTGDSGLGGFGYGQPQVGDVGSYYPGGTGNGWGAGDGWGSSSPGRSPVWLDRRPSLFRRFIRFILGLIRSILGIFLPGLFRSPFAPFK